MNPLLKNQFDTVRKQLESLRTVLENNHTEVSKQHEEKEELLQEKWRQRKRVTTLERIEEDYDALDEENKRYNQERGEIKENLAEIVQLSKALHRIQKP